MNKTLIQTLKLAKDCLYADIITPAAKQVLVNQLDIAIKAAKLEESARDMISLLREAFDDSTKYHNFNDFLRDKFLSKEDNSTPFHDMSKILDFIGTKVTYDDNGQIIWGKLEDSSLQMLLDLRGWGAIQGLFKTEKGAVDFVKAEKFQDELGQWFVDAINEKLEKERTKP